LFAIPWYIKSITIPVVPINVDYTIANGTRLASGFYTGATITLLSTAKTMFHHKYKTHW
jgi:hypothetical protein